MNWLILLFLIGASDFRYETEHFVIESHSDLKKLSISIIETAEEQYSRIKRMMPVELSKKINIKVANSMDEYEAMQPEGMKAPTWSVGIAYPKRRLIVLRGDPNHGPDEILKTFRHELAHIFLYNYSEVRIPVWFSEGFSMYFESEGGILRSFSLIRQAFANEYIDIDKLEDGFPDNPVDIHNAYLTSSEFFSFLLSRINEEGLYKVFEYIKEGNDIRFAIFRVSGKTLSEMELEFKKSARFRYAWLPVITSSTTLWILLTLFFVYVFIIKQRRTDLKLAAMRKEEEQLLLEMLNSENSDEVKKQNTRYLN